MYDAALHIVCILIVQCAVGVFEGTLYNYLFVTVYDESEEINQNYVCYEVDLN